MLLSRPIGTRGTYLNRALPVVFLVFGPMISCNKKTNSTAQEATSGLNEGSGTGASTEPLTPVQNCQVSLSQIYNIGHTDYPDLKVGIRNYADIVIVTDHRDKTQAAFDTNGVVTVSDEDGKQQPQGLPPHSAGYGDQVDRALGVLNLIVSSLDPKSPQIADPFDGLRAYLACLKTL